MPLHDGYMDHNWNVMTYILNAFVEGFLQTVFTAYLAQKLDGRDVKLFTFFVPKSNAIQYL